MVTMMTAGEVDDDAGHGGRRGARTRRYLVFLPSNIILYCIYKFKGRPYAVPAT